MKRIVCLFLFLISVNTFAALSSTEIKIRDKVTSHQSEQIKLLKKLVNINSGSTNLVGVRKVARIMEKELQRLGFKTRWVPEPASLHRAGTLLAERSGNTGKSVLIIGHLDTVYAPDGRSQRFELKKHSAKGPGVSDDKGGLVVMLYALKALKEAHALDNTSLTIALVGDEEDSGKPTTLSRRTLIKAAEKKAVAIDFEPAINLETATIARRGISHWALEAHGNESHSATIFHEDVGDGAIFEISRILTAMRTQFKDEKNLSFNPGFLLGGNKITDDKKTSRGTVFGKENVVAKIALAKGDMRFIDKAQRETFKSKLIELTKQHLPGTTSQFTFEDGMPAMPPTENNLKLLEQYSAVSQDLGLGTVKPFDPALRGAGDISYVADIVPANLSGLGPIGYGTHSSLEAVELPSFPEQTKRAAILIYRLTHE